MKQLGLDLTEAPQQRRTAALESYHVRSHQTAAEAIQGERRANRQEAMILLWFGCGFHQRSKRWTPSQVASVFPQWPLTSVRRALTNLTNRGWLQHHPQDRRPGPMGAKESCWSLAG